MTKRFYVNMAAIMDESMDLNQWNILLQAAIKEWRKHNKVIGQVKISYKKILRKCRELSLAGGKYREYQGLCAKYQCARLTAVTKGLVF